MTEPRTLSRLHDAAGRPIPPALQELCAAIYEFPGLAIRQAVAPQPYHPWCVFIGCRDQPSLAAYASLEFLVWLQHEARTSGFADLFIGVNAPPPYLNGVGRSLYLFIESTSGEPNILAHLIRRRRTSLFALP